MLEELQREIEIAGDIEVAAVWGKKNQEECRCKSMNMP